MPVDPLLNCAAEICCGPLPPVASAVTSYNQPAHDARMKVLAKLGITGELAEKASREMASLGIVFLTAQLATAIREIAFPAEEQQ